MRQLGGYRIEHFLKNDFYASQYFALLNLIDLERELDEKRYKQIEKDSKKK